MGRPRLPPERLWQRLDKQSADGCWEYLGGKDRDGYGRVRIWPIYIRAHRLAWTLTHGPIPVGLKVLHCCDNPPCCNPAHLFLGTNLDNVADKVRKGRQARGAWMAKNRVNGERHPHAKLTDEQVATIRDLARIGVEQKEIAQRFDISQAHVSNIWLRKSRRTLTLFGKESA